MSETPTHTPLTPGALVDEFLRLPMVPDPAAARHLVAPESRTRFAGARKRGDPAECTAFEGRRCVDRHDVRHGLIAQMDVRNDSAERRPVRAGLAAR
jgi:hypothetical protein